MMKSSSGLSSQYVDNSRKIDNFVRAVEAATDIKGENLAIERELAQSSSVGSLPSSSENAKVDTFTESGAALYSNTNLV